MLEEIGMIKQILILKNKTSFIILLSIKWSMLIVNKSVLKKYQKKVFYVSFLD